ncbi:helix-turn-helix domain-containing protein [Evansella sp. LMS18]|uniref:PucR family transcriptional regulator n=1 Tax=Evansella sp. LMS18 TaxID=2924033 RepID=UPI0020D10DB3|nr:helix-turn-helix domain-containing protein [Evansella sp. LMS18]UTR09208.1 helix-turn-helix domain-containing protein [Evansella sp. LMS18]
MLDKLKNYYAGQLTENAETIPEEYRLTLYEENEEEIILDKRKLSREEVSLLETLFNNSPGLPSRSFSVSEEMMYNWLFKEKTPDFSLLKNIINPPVRLVHFYIKGRLSDHESFEEALKSLFVSSQSLIWASPTEGFLLQEITADSEDMETDESIPDIIASDFFVQAVFYTGSILSEVADLKDRHAWEAEAFRTARLVMPAKSIYIEQEIVPALMINELTNESRQKLLELLEPVLNEHDLLESVKVYLECNMNTSMAAKKLYMHRNTVQYRVDKFIEKTSIDIKRFPNAVAVYILFLLSQAASQGSDN